MGRKHYPGEYRDRLIALARSGRSVSSLAEEFEPTSQSIRNWLDRTNGPGEPDDSKELRRLRRELARTKEELDNLLIAPVWIYASTIKHTSCSRGDN